MVASRDEGPGDGSTPSTPATLSTPTFRLAAFYLLYFTALGALVPYWGPYLKHLGFSPVEIGELVAVFMATRIAAPLLAGWLSDRYGRRMVLVRLTTLGSCVAFAGVLGGQSYAWLALVSGLFSFCRAATLPPYEATVLNHLGRQAERYGRLRVWGSVGFILGVVALGWLLERYGEPLLPPVVLGIFVAVALLSMTIPGHPGRPTTGESPRLMQVLLRPDVLGLFAVSVLMVASHGPYYTFITIHLENNGYSKSQIGPLWGLGVLAEVGMFLVTGRLLQRFSARALMVASLALTAARWVLIALFVNNLAVLLFAQTLHAFSFGLFHAVNIHVIHRRFTGPLQARGQALYAAISHGLGGALGSLAAGYAWAGIGADNTYLAAAALPALGVLIAAMTLRD
jgi:MFS transporter, PPP family, 3-phenylpropionic acid transporter